MGEVPVKRWDALIDMSICRGTYDQRAMGRGVKNGVARASAMASAGQVTWCSQSLSTLLEAPRDRKKKYKVYRSNFLLSNNYAQSGDYLRFLRR